MKLRSLREGGPGWDARFFEKDARFWPIRRAACAFAEEPDWPSPETYARAFEGRPQVRFETQEPRVRVRRGQRLPIDRSTLYDACIMQGFVPTRARHWHDFLNALVWATFPRAKWALHTRQHALIEAWLPEGAYVLPNARTKTQDAVALIDEGGVLLLRGHGRELTVPFGHALFEGLVFDMPSMVARAVVIEAEGPLDSVDQVLEAADVGLATRITGIASPAELSRFAFHGDAEAASQLAAGP